MTTMMLDKINNFIGKKISERRLRLNMPLYEMAERLRLPYIEIENYEEGKATIYASTLFDIANVLQTNLSYFYDSKQEVRQQI